MKLRVYSRRWGHRDCYTIERTAEGWFVGFVIIAGHCDPTGSPFLFKNLRHDSINYPDALGRYMDWLWRQNLSEEKLQEYLDLLGDWISQTEKSTPQGVFAAYN